MCLYFGVSSINFREIISLTSVYLGHAFWAKALSHNPDSLLLQHGHGWMPAPETNVSIDFFAHQCAVAAHATIS